MEALEQRDRKSPVNQTLKTWWAIREVTHLSPTPSPLIPLTYNRNLGGGLPPRAWSFLGGNGPKLIHRIFDKLSLFVGCEDTDFGLGLTLALLELSTSSTELRG
ncbi:Hypothetical predicted protein [Pelobates cultripes]|uniref:Uncharacterized protein n=1 Tax=Pelobates cultripes TaxID=61616 RepID=A0AAD1S6N0_PELCU|nr:Hypothetical predicted protein [Pelobates cultripes]